MAPYQFIDRPSPFNTKGGKTLPIFAVTPAHIETGMVDPVAYEWAKKAGYNGDDAARTGDHGAVERGGGRRHPARALAPWLP